MPNEISNKKIDLDKLYLPEGRCQTIERNGLVVIIDSSHTPDAIDNFLKSVKISYPNRKIVTLFGCGGDRDRSKRPIMATVVSRNSDSIVVSSDNSRSEEPGDIIADILPGIVGENYTVIEDRKEAVHETIAKLTEEEVLCLIGKGPEDYQLIKGVKHPYSDESATLESLNTRFKK